MYLLFLFRIELGEIFLLLSPIDDEWGWGRSQASGQSGLIPIVIMEDVVSESLIVDQVFTGVLPCEHAVGV